MIFELYFFLISAGAQASGVLLGNYLMRYSGASELSLGYVFMIHPLAVFARPLICAQADRYQSHKKLLTWCLFGNSVFYTPFVVLPYLLREPSLAETLTNDVCFWILAISHLLGSLCFCGVRSLGDALAVNYAKRTGRDYSCYKKYGSLSFAISGLLVGQVNKGWILPDFVASSTALVGSMGILSILAYLWPDEYFVIVSDSQLDCSGNSDKSIPSGRETFNRIRAKIFRLITCSCCSEGFDPQSVQPAPVNKPQVDSIGRLALTIGKPSYSSTHTNDPREGSKRSVHLTVKQQTSIFYLLMKKDYRIPLYFALLLFCGMVGYAPQNFVFAYMDKVCNETGTCNSAYLGGITMFAYCSAETICYLIINAFRKSINQLMLLQATLASVTIHYYFYGFLLPHLSPYFFLVESLHGFEYSSHLTSSVELAYRFASQVELLIPELIQEGVIHEYDDHELIKVSLMATMNACFTMVYDGAGCILGAFIYGIVADGYGFEITWKMIGTLATTGFCAVLVIVLVGKCLKLQPQIMKLGARSAPSSSVAPISSG